MGEPMPPVPRFKLTVEIEGNTLDDVLNEAYSVGINAPAQIRGRDECEIVGGSRTIRLTHQNPDMTPQQYASELAEWSRLRRSRPAPEVSQ